MEGPLHIDAAHVDRAVGALVEAGKRHEERVVLLLAARNNPGRIVDVYEPVQVCRIDQFHIPPEGMRQMMAHLRAQRLALVAQIHSHPQAAFHSKADNEWAIVRHEGALSIVVPNFAHGISARSFVQAAAFYRLSAGDVWEQVAGIDVEHHFRVEFQ